MSVILVFVLINLHTANLVQMHANVLEIILNRNDFFVCHLKVMPTMVITEN